MLDFVQRDAYNTSMPRSDDALPTQRTKIIDRYDIHTRINFYTQRWNCGPDVPVKIWDDDGRRSIPGQMMFEAGVAPRYLNVDGVPGRRYMHTHIVPDDVVKMRKDFEWLVGRIVPQGIADNMQPKGEKLPVPLCLLTENPTKLYDLLVLLNDRVAALDTETDKVVPCMTWQTRAYWIRETLRTQGVGISFRSSSK